MSATTETKCCNERSVLPGVLGRVLIGLFLAVFALEALVACLFGHWLALLAMVFGFVAMWKLTKPIAWSGLRIFIRSLGAGILFTPYVPTPSIEWSSPWPPAAFLLLVGASQGELMIWPLTLILVSVALLWAAGWGVHTHRRRPSTQPTMCDEGSARQ